MPADEPTWSDIAPWYDDLIVAGSGPHETAVDCLLRLVPPLDGLEVLDIGCGQGLATRALAAAGAAHVTGVDSSTAMLDIARRRTSEPTTPDPAASRRSAIDHGDRRGTGAITYVHDDAQTLATVADTSVDGVTCQLAVMDIPDLAATVSAVHRVLRPGGWFAFVIGHPCFLAPDARPTTLDGGRPAMAVAGYFDERFWRSANPQGVRRAGNHHRTLTTYLNALIGAGLVLEQVDEPRPGPRLAAERPVYAEVPIFFAARACRPRPPAAVPPG